MRVSLTDHGETITGVFTRGYALGEEHYAIGTSGKLYRMLFSSDEDGGHEAVTLVPVKVEVVVPKQIDVRV